MPNPTLEHPPFRPLTWDHGGWGSTIILTAWSGYSIRSSLEGPRRSGQSDGAVDLVIETQPTPTMPFPPPTPAQTAAFDFALKNQHEIQCAIFEALLPFYGDKRPDYKAFFGRDFKLLMPKAINVAIFRELIRPGSIYLHTDEKAGLAYTGILFASWEMEHALGLCLHGSHVVDIGDSEAAIYCRIAR